MVKGEMADAVLLYRVQVENGTVDFGERGNDP